MLLAVLLVAPPGPAPAWIWRAAVAAALATAVAVRADFPVRPQPHRLRVAAAIGVGALLLALAHDAAALVRWPAGGSPLGFAATVAAVAALAVALAAAPAPPPADPDTRAAVTALVAHPDADTLAPFATRRDKAYAFSPDGRAAIGYRVLFGTALAGGDPVGAAAGKPAAVGAFVDTCVRNGWRPAVLGVGADLVPAWHAHGLRHGLVVGDEAILDVAAFSLASRRMRNVRQAVRRTHNAGLTVTIGDLDHALAARLAPVLADWLRGGAERGFAMTLDRLLTPRPDCVVAVAYDRHGEPQAFARFAVCAAGRVLTLDVAPRRRDAPNGVVERLIVEAVGYGRERGVAEVSLNFAGLRRLFDAPRGSARVDTRVDTRVGTRVAAGLAHLLDGWIELAPLCRFTAKFHPAWRPRRLLLRSWLDVAGVALAALTAEFGRGVPAPDPPAPGEELAQQPAPA
jgi:lysyl-tRNA synthetase class 2